jgi:predicted RNA-binding Zn-ribbon protein involved in translation (DUF1610 family)
VSTYTHITVNPRSCLSCSTVFTPSNKGTHAKWCPVCRKERVKDQWREHAARKRAEEKQEMETIKGKWRIAI